MSFRVIIPARFASSRLPGKPLLEIAGKTMLQHVYDRALQSGADSVVIATDDARIESCVKDFGGKVCMTSAEHQSGTDRLAEVVSQLGLEDDEIVVNVQGDEPLIPPTLIKQTADDLAHYPSASVSTVATPIHTAAELFDPHVVKVVLDKEDFALYFSRATIPWDRDAFSVTTEELPEQALHYRHIGIYGYRCRFLKDYSELPPSPLERMEALEQLRAMWHGYRIHVSIVNEPPGHGVDTDADLLRVRSLLEESVSTNIVKSE
ncbi:MAG: 3-deoxy-manno-octulosonate cytidylyltransferase [Gammaproteobacteria bacterium]|nr:3-deoxy-manno-octulosonate cytidylyltransferase [Gammaproteobacteria bacterium]